MIHNGVKQTTFVSGGLGLLETVSKPDTGRYASEDAGLPKGVDCEIPHRLESGTQHSLYGYVNLFLANTF